jgi:hypothetical protein
MFSEVKFKHADMWDVNNRFNRVESEQFTSGGNQSLAADFSLNNNNRQDERFIDSIDENNTS